MKTLSTILVIVALLFGGFVGASHAGDHATSQQQHHAAHTDAGHDDGKSSLAKAVCDMACHAGCMAAILQGVNVLRAVPVPVFAVFTFNDVLLSHLPATPDQPPRHS